MADSGRRKDSSGRISRKKLLRAALGGTAGVVGATSLARFAETPVHAEQHPAANDAPDARRRKATDLLVRAQARGGKYLGDDIGGALVTVRDVQSNAVLACGPTSGNAGTLVKRYASGSSRSVVVTPGTAPGVWWLVPDGATSSFKCRINLDQPTLLEIAVAGPVGGLQSSQRSTVTRWVRPGEAIDITVDIPGLLLQVLTPPTHLELSGPGSVVQLRAKVAMMCGCPIQPGMPWIPQDFEVVARIRRLPSTPVADVRLSFASARTPGIFVGQFRVPKPGFYVAAVESRQLSTDNFGLGEVTFFTTPPSA